MKQILIVLKKELLEMFRGKGTLAIFLLPVLIFPILNSGLSYINKESGIAINVALDCNDSNFEAIFNDFSVNEGEQKINLINTNDPSSALKNGLVDCFLEVENNDIRFIFNPYSYNSISSATKLGESFENFYKKTLANTGIYNFSLQDSNHNAANISLSISNMIIPVLLLSVLLKGSSGFAADLFAGERERKTLELLLLSGISKYKLYFGKLSALLLVSLLNAILGISGWLFAYRNSLDLFGFMQAENIQLNIFAIISTLISLSILFSILYTTISLIAKNVRNTHFINDILSFIPIGIAIISAITTIRADKLFFCFIPIFNLSNCFCTAFFGTTELSQLLLTLIVNAVYMAALISGGIKYMHTERFAR